MLTNVYLDDILVPTASPSLVCLAPNCIGYMLPAAGFIGSPKSETKPVQRIDFTGKQQMLTVRPSPTHPYQLPRRCVYE